MTMNEVADEINGLFRKYGLDHEVVTVDPAPYGDRLVFIKASNPAAMELLLTTLAYVFDGFFETHPATDQMRLF